jgi:hypothetical protein
MRSKRQKQVNIPGVLDKAVRIGNQPDGGRQAMKYFSLRTRDLK